MSSRIIVSGSLAYDHIMDFPGLFAEHFMPEKLHSINLSFQVDKLSTQFGGTAGNIAYSLALLGERPEIIATAGKDFSSYRAHLMHEGIDTDTIAIDESDVTSSAYVLTDKADNQIAAFHSGAGGKAYDTPVTTEGRALAIVAPGCVSDMSALPSYYRERGLKYLYDPAQQITSLSPEQLKDGMNGAQIFFASDYEFELVKQKTGWSDEEILGKVPVAAVTYGAQGSDVITKEGKVHLQACPAQAVVDPTGAGDAYRAGFIKGLLIGAPLPVCAQLGATAAAYVVETYGTQTHKFTVEEFGHRYQKTFGDPPAGLKAE